MAEERKFFDMSSKQSLALGLTAGIAIVSLVGFGALLLGGNADDAEAKPTANINVNANPAPAPTPAPEPAGDVTKLSPVTSSDHIRGGSNAKVTLIVVSDFQCPYCGRHETTMNQLLDEYGDKIRIVWRNMPLTSIHPYAQKAAEAGECAGEQDKFWEMHDKMFANQSALTVDNLKQYAKDLGLNSSKFDSCLDSGKYTDKVNKQSAEAQAAGITGTPGTFVNNQLVKGAYPIETFKGIIDTLLK